MLRPALAVLLLLAAGLSASAREGARWCSSALATEIRPSEEGESGRQAVALERASAEWRVEVHGAVAVGRLVEIFRAPGPLAERVALHFAPPPGAEVQRLLASVDGRERELVVMPAKPRQVDGRLRRPVAGLQRSEYFDWPEGARVQLITELALPLGFDEGWFELELPAIGSDCLDENERGARRTPRGAARSPAPSKTAGREANREGKERHETEAEPESRAPEPASLAVRVRIHQGEALAEIESDTHELYVSDEGGASLAEIDGPALVEEGAVRLRYRLASEREDEAGLGGWLTEPREDGTRDILVVLTPPKETPRDRVAATDAIFVLDTSGSMRNAKLEQARAGVAAALEYLDSQDGVALIRFSDGMELWSAGLVPAGTATRSDARRWLDGLNAEGSTKLVEGLRRALLLAATAEKLPLVVVLTDGAIQDAEAVEKLLSAAGGRARVLFVGIGAEPQRDVLLRLAAVARGDAAFAAGAGQVVDAVKGLFGSFSAPLAWDLRLEAPGAEIVGTWPPRLPDLYEGRPVSAWVRVRGMPSELRLRADTVDGPDGLDRALRTDAAPESPALRAPPALDR